jgi:cephalosporin hydroxylase
MRRLVQAIRMQMPDVPVKNAELPMFEVNPHEISRFVLKKLVPVAGISPFPLHELMLMAGTIVRFRPTHVYEWGTNIGVSARVFWETARYYGVPTEIHSIDLPDDVAHVEHPGRRRGQLVRGKKGVTLHQGDGLDTALALCRSAGAPRPLFFLDGDHSYESVRRELDGIVQHVADPVVLAHDTFRQAPASGYNVGPAEAVFAFRARFRSVELALGVPGMTLLY